jgi:hypothetical protein
MPFATARAQSALALVQLAASSVLQRHGRRFSDTALAEVVQPGVYWFDSAIGDVTRL